MQHHNSYPAKTTERRKEKAERERSKKLSHQKASAMICDDSVQQFTEEEVIQEQVQDQIHGRGHFQVVSFPRE